MGAIAKGRERFNVIVGAAQTVGRPLVLLSACHHGELHSGLLFAERRKDDSFRPLAFTKTFSMFFAVGSWIGAGSRPDDVADPRQDHAGEKESDQRVF